MDIIKKLINLKPSELTQKIEDLISKSIDTRKIVVSGNTSTDNKIKLLADDTYKFNLYYACIQFLEFKTTNKEDKEKIDKLLSVIREYNLQYNTDIELLKAILNLHKDAENLTLEKRFFLLRTIKSMEKHGTCNDEHSKILALLKNIDQTEILINSILDKPLKINIDRNKIDAKSESIMSSVYPDKSNNIYLDKSKYYYLVKQISDKNIRTYLEREFMRRYNELLPALSKVIISRNVYANLLGYESFYKLCSNKSDDDTKNLKIMLEDLNNKIDFQLKNTLSIIKDLIGAKDKLSISDIIFGLNKFFPDIKLEPFDILNVAFAKIKDKFKIHFTGSKMTPLNSNSSTIEIYDATNKLRGYLYLDLLKENNKIKQMTLLKLMNGYGEQVPILYLMGVFPDLKKPICSYSDVITIFRELGHVIVQIFSYTPLGIAEDDVELINFIPDLMEYIAYDSNTIMSLVRDKNITNRIKKAREHELLINLKLKCIGILFDNIVHSSKEFITLLTNTKNNYFLLDLYKKVFADIFNNLSDLVDCNLTFILPSVIHNLINGHQGISYGNILSTILAFNVYEHITKNNKAKELVYLLENKNFSYKKNLISFITTLNEDYYKNFLKNCLKVKDESLDNYFDEGITEAEKTVEEMR